MTNPKTKEIEFMIFAFVGVFTNLNSQISQITTFIVVTRIFKLSNFQIIKSETKMPFCPHNHYFWKKYRGL